MGASPPLLSDYRRRKQYKTKKSFLCCSKSSLFLVFGAAFLIYTFIQRSNNASSYPSLNDAQGFLSRRDLKEKYEYLQEMLHARRSAIQSRGTTIFPATPTSRRLLLATHNRLMWYHYDTQQLTIIHEGQGIYYGGFPGEKLDEHGTPSTLWVVSRPHNWRPKTAQEWLLHLEANTGTEIERRPLESRFTHDVVRKGNAVYVANTGDGSIIELEFPSMKEVKRHTLFTEKEHVNTLSPTRDGRMWAMLHNLGPSILAEIDMDTSTVVRRLVNVGTKSHGAVQWQDSIIALDSDHASLIKIDTRRSKTTNLWSADEPNKYLKALAVVDDIAFFGIAESRRRQNRDSTDLNCELAAFDLKEGVLLWRRQLPTRGLLNVVAAPHLQVESTAVAVYMSDPRYGYRNTEAYKEVLEAAKSRQNLYVSNIQNSSTSTRDSTRDDSRGTVLLEQEQENLHRINNALVSNKDSNAAANNNNNNNKNGLLPVPDGHPLLKYPPKLGSAWVSGFPRFDLNLKGKKTGGLSAGAQLLLSQEDVSQLRDYVLAMPQNHWEEEGQRESNAWFSGRSNNLNQFKPGTFSIHLIFSDQMGEKVYEFPWYKKRFARMLDPILNKVLGDEVKNIIRLQFALMPANTHIKRHVDSGGYSASGHRLHLVVATNDKVEFQVCERSECLPLILKEGLLFELNNRLDHFVDNNGDSPRVHLVIDVAESPRGRIKLVPGQVCFYDRGAIKC